MTAMTGNFERFAGYCAVVTGVGGFLYSIAFVLVARAAPDLGQNLSWLLLLIGGLLTMPVLIALFQRLREIDPGIAMWALILGLAGTLGATVHSGYALANVLHPPSGGIPDLPSPIDPRGLLTFGFAGAGLLGFARLLRRSSSVPAGLGVLAAIAGALLIVIYLARLIVFDASNPVVLIPAALSGFFISPAWYVWLGLVLARD